MAKEVLEMEVKSNIKNVTKETDKLGKSIGKASDNTQDLDKGLEETGKSGSKGFKAIGTAVKGFGMALKAAGIGLVIALFVTLKEAMERNQKVMDTVNTIMTTISTTFNQVVNVLVDTYNWVTKSSDRFNGLGKVLKGIMTLALTPLQLAFFGLKLGVQQLMLAWEKSPLGKGDEGKIAELRIGIGKTQTSIERLAKEAVEAGKSIVNNFGDAVSEIGAIATRVVDGVTDISIKANYEMAQATIAAQNSAKLAEAQLQGLIEKNDLLAEKQRQIRDDETKTFAERIAANEELGRVLDKQEVEMLKLADARVSAAALELSANKDNIDLQVAYQQTLNDRAGVEAQIAGFRSEQMTNEVSLNKELLEVQNELRASGLAGIELELAELEAAYKQKLVMADKSGADITALTKQYEGQKDQIVAAGVANQISAYSGLTSALGALAGENKALSVATAIMDTYAAANSVLKDPTLIGPSRWVSAAAVIATGLANVRTILQTEVPGGGGGGGGGATPSAPAPQMMSGAFDLSGGQAPEAMRAYVVTDEMTNSQNQLANIRRRATI
tara:strand:+ start:5629 stop:7299 length:1671 start_codon:yes stop_codon:yes gene_type:complete